MCSLLNRFPKVCFCGSFQHLCVVLWSLLLSTANQTLRKPWITIHLIYLDVDELLFFSPPIFANPKPLKYQYIWNLTFFVQHFQFVKPNLYFGTHTCRPHIYVRQLDINPKVPKLSAAYHDFQGRSQTKGPPGSRVNDDGSLTLLTSIYSVFLLKSYGLVGVGGPQRKFELRPWWFFK